MKKGAAKESMPSSKTVVPELPSVLTTEGGRQYDVTGDVWILPKNLETEATVKFDWTTLTDLTVVGGSTPVMSERAVSLVKLYILDRMTTAKGAINPKSGKNILHSTAHFAQWLVAHPEFLAVSRGFEWSDLTEDMFDAWLSAEYRMKRKGDSARHVRNFYLWGTGADATYPDFSPELASILRAKRIRKRPSGEVVESRDPRRGPFTREELDLITRACEAGLGENQDRAIVWTLRQTGIRPLQLYNLRNQDLEVIKREKGEDHHDSLQPNVMYRLRVRKIKLRNKVIKFHYLPLSEGCARLLLNLRKPGSGPDERLFWWISLSYNSYIEHHLSAFSRDVNLRSPRLPIKKPKPGGPFHDLMPLTARRFRYSVATERVSLGESSENVAAMLGHAGTKKVHVYVETSPGIADDFQRATDYAISPLIDLMEGRTQPSEVDLLAEPGPVSSKFRPHDEQIRFPKGSCRPPYNKGEQPAIVATSVERPNKSEARIEELIASGRRRFPQVYPGQNFDSQLWDVAILRERPNTTGMVNFGFTKLATNQRMRYSTRPEDSLPTYFGNVIKSWLVLESDISLSYRSKRLHATRYFWSFLSTRGTLGGNEFAWGDLSEDDMLWFEQFLIAYRTARGTQLSPKMIRIIIFNVQRLVDFLFSRGICRRINYQPQTQLKGTRSSHLLDDKKFAAEMKLPAPGVLEALGSIYYRLTTAPADEVSDWILIVISAVAILILTGLRIGELVTLPYDCEVEEQLPKEQNGDSYSCRYGIRYWVEKTGQKTMRIKWISPTAESIVRASIARIKCLTAAARERARILEADPTRIPLPPEIANHTVLTTSELCALLGWKGYNRGHELLKPRGERGNHHYSVEDLEKYLLAKRKTLLYTVRHDDGSVQKLSESLLIIFNKQSRCRQMDSCRLLVEPVSANTIKLYLRSRITLFRAYGDTDEQRGLSVQPHSFRHWLIHVAYMGGMKVELILRYFAKRYTSGVADYLHFSTDESDAYAPEELRMQRFFVPVGGEMMEEERA